jgi:6,7-dimethyl-8-ribityllumazine synthase
LVSIAPACFCLPCVVDGGIYRHEFVADTVIKALMCS